MLAARQRKEVVATQASAVLELDPNSFRAVLRRALDKDTIELLSWSAEPLGGAANDVTGGLFLVTGTAHDRGEVAPWSLVVKVARNPSDALMPTEDRSHVNYWRREPLLYQSGLLEALPLGFAAPRCYGVDESRPGQVTVFLEHVSDDEDNRWPIERYALAARHLGRFNGAFLVGRPVPREDFLCRGYLRMMAAWLEPYFGRASSTLDHPMVRETWSRSLIEWQIRVFDDRAAFFAALDRLPPTFCHLDAWRKNLLSRRLADGTVETVAIDWGFGGIGALGEDLATLVGADVMTWLREPEELPQLEAAVFDAYLEGLADVGWRGDRRLARLGYTITVALRWGGMPFWAWIDDEAFTSRLELTWQRPFAELLARQARLTAVLCDRADEARALIAELGLD
jgi:hypothetical protein